MKRPRPSYLGRTVTILVLSGAFLASYQHGDFGNRTAPSVTQIPAAIGPIGCWR